MSLYKTVTKVDFDEMSSMISNLEKDYEEMKRLLIQAKKDVDELNMSWEGQNHDNFEKDFIAKYNFLNDNNKKLENYVEALKKIKQRYEKTENSISSLI